MPSHIQSWSLAGLRSAKGSTAMLGEASAAPGPGAARCAFHRYHPTPGAPSAMPRATSSRSIRGRGAGAVFSMRPARTSKTQASTSVKGKPRPSATTVMVRTHSGRLSPCMMGSMI